MEFRLNKIKPESTIIISPFVFTRFSSCDSEYYSVEDNLNGRECIGFVVTHNEIDYNSLIDDILYCFDKPLKFLTSKDYYNLIAEMKNLEPKNKVGKRINGHFHVKHISADKSHYKLCNQLIEFFGNFPTTEFCAKCGENKIYVSLLSTNDNTTYHLKPALSMIHKGYDKNYCIFCSQENNVSFKMI